MVAGKVQHCLGRRQPLDAQALDRKIDALLGRDQLDIGSDFPALILLRITSRQQLADRGDQIGKRGQQHRAFGKIDDFVRAALAETNFNPPPLALRAHGGPAAAMRRRQVRRCDQRGLKSLPARRIGNPLGDEGGKRFLVELLQLAAAACAEMAAGWRCMMRPMLKRAVGQQRVARRGPDDKPSARGYAIAFGGNPQYLLRVIHRQVA